MGVGPVERSGSRWSIVGWSAVALAAAWALLRPDAVAGVFQFVFSIITPFVLGLVIAFLVNLLLRPVERGWERMFHTRPFLLRLKRPVGIAVAVFLIAAAAFVVLFIVLPEVGKTVLLVAEALPHYLETLQTLWEALDERLDGPWVQLPSLDVEADEAADAAREWVATQGPALLAKTLGFTTSVVRGAVNVVIALVFSLYLLADKERLQRQGRRLLFAFLPEAKAGHVVEVAELIHSTFAKFVTGQLTDALIVGLLCFIGMLALSLPYPGAISVLVGVTTIVPVVGVLAGTVLGALLIVVVDPLKALWFLLFIVVLQQLESNVIYPRVVGKSVGLPGLWVFAAVIIGGSTFGVLGMLVSVPVFSVAYALLRRAVDGRTVGPDTGEEFPAKDASPSVTGKT